MPNHIDKCSIRQHKCEFGAIVHYRGRINCSLTLGHKDYVDVFSALKLVQANPAASCRAHQHCFGKNGCTKWLRKHIVKVQDGSISVLQAHLESTHDSKKGERNWRVRSGYRNIVRHKQNDHAAFTDIRNVDKQADRYDK